MLGYARIAGMPVVTGLYTILLPMAVFAVAGSSRHLVVGADSATAAILAAALAGSAAAGSPRYVALAGLAALVTGGLLLLARLVRLGFIAEFLSRTVLIGFLTGVGVSVAAGQLPAMLGVQAGGSGAVRELVATVRAAPDAGGTTVAMSLAVVVLVLVLRRLVPRVPAALLAVAASILLSRALHLADHGVRVLGTVPGGLPHLGFPAVGWSDVSPLLGPAASMAVVILAQSAATSRAYAGKYDETYSPDRDLVGLALANAAAAGTGTFVVNGSPTKTQIVDGAGGRGRLAPLTAAVVVLAVLMFLTGPLAYLPLAALASVVFLIGTELVDLHGMRRILAVRRHEFGVALLTALAVLVLGVEQGIVLAIVASVVDHLRHSYEPYNTVLVPGAGGHWSSVPASGAERSADGLVIYRFGSSLYFANAHRLLEDVTAFVRAGAPVAVLCLDGAAIADIDYTAADVLRGLQRRLRERRVRLVLCDLSGPVRAELDRYGITRLLGADNFFSGPADVLALPTSGSGSAGKAPAG